MTVSQRGTFQSQLENPIVSHDSMTIRPGQRSDRRYPHAPTTALAVVVGGQRLTKLFQRLYAGLPWRSPDMQIQHFEQPSIRSDLQPRSHLFTLCQQPTQLGVMNDANRIADKVKHVHHCDDQTREEAKKDLFDYIELFYNRQRRRSHLGYRTPAQAEADAA